MTDYAEDEGKPAPIKYKVKTDGFNIPNVRKAEFANIRETSGRLKQVCLFYMGKPGSEPKPEPTSIILGTYERSTTGSGYDFDNPVEQWRGRAEDVQMLRAVLNDKFDGTGTFLSDPNGAVSEALRALHKSQLPPERIQALLESLAESPDAQALFATADAAKLLADSVNLQRNRAAVDRLERVALDPSSAEADFQEVLQDNWWLFGGRYVDLSPRRTLVLQDQMDIPLVRSDGSLHVVELKKANVPAVVTDYRSHSIVGKEVNEAVGQTINYLRGLDEQRDHILAQFKVDVRRASATVVIGHAAHVAPDLRDVLHETLRTYSAQLSRIEVISYDTLIDGARRSLELEG